MTSKMTNKFSPEVRERAVRMVLEHEAQHPSRWATSRTVMHLLSEASAMTAPPVQALDGTFHSGVVIEARASLATFSRTFFAASKQRWKIGSRIIRMTDRDR